MAKRKRWRRWPKAWTWRRVTAAVGVVLAAWLAWEYATLPSAAPLAKSNPEKTALMRQREEEARDKGKKPRQRQRWVRLREISPVALDAIICSEDTAFYEHEGVDVKELEKVLAESWEKGKLIRGASTITQQLAKNLWLSTDRSLLRKAKELVLARRLEGALDKERILELYVNVVEWGDGIYGIDEAAREYFGVSARGVDPAQAAILAGMLPSPRKWLPARHPAPLYKRARIIVARLEAAGRLTPAEADAALDEIEQRIGPVRPHRPTVTAPPAVAPPEPVEPDEDEEAAEEEVAPEEKPAEPAPAPAAAPAQEKPEPPPTPAADLDASVP